MRVLGWEGRVCEDGVLGFSDGVFLLFLLFFFFLALFRNEKGVYSCISNGSRHITT